MIKREKLLHASMMYKLIKRQDQFGNYIPFSIRARSIKGSDLSGDSVRFAGEYKNAEKTKSSGDILLLYPSGEKRRVRTCLIFKINEYTIKLT